MSPSDRGTGDRPLAVGLVGAGPWASMLHAPMLAAGPYTTLTGIWARRSEAAAALAEAHGVVAFGRYDQLIDASEAVAFAVAPDAQADLAPAAARAGRHLLLEKPLALDLPAAEALVRAVDDSGVVSQMVLTQRYTPVMAEFIAAARTSAPVAARLASISGAALDGAVFATPWRVRYGALLDIGPHVLDLAQAMLGPVDDITAIGHPLGVVLLSCRHIGGAVSQAALSIAQRIDPPVWRAEVYGRAGNAVFDADEVDMEAQFRSAAESIPRELAQSVHTGKGHPLDASHGLELQRLLDRASGMLSSPHTRG